MTFLIFGVAAIVVTTFQVALNIKCDSICEMPGI